MRSQCSKSLSVVITICLLLATAFAQTASSNGTRLRSSTLTAAGSIMGTVSAAGTNPVVRVGGATVTVFSGALKISTATTASDGTYTIPNLANGIYTVAKIGRAS